MDKTTWPYVSKGVNVDNLTSFEKDMLIRKLLHHMDLDTRGKIMEELPVIYVKLHPQTRNTVLRKVMTATRPHARA